MQKAEFPPLALLCRFRQRRARFGVDNREGRCTLCTVFIRHVRAAINTCFLVHQREQARPTLTTLPVLVYAVQDFEKS